MAKSLFALENGDMLDQNEELETSPEEGQAAAVQTEAESESAEVTELSDSVDGGVEASDQLEEVQDLVEGAGDEGLSPLAAEAVRIAISSIASKVGANPRAVYSLYAVENFQSASSRRANTAYALEGVQDFLKDLWKKIKAALTKLWGKMKSFWAKHLSNVGRMVKALDSMKTKVKSSSGKITGKAYLDKAPSAIANYYKGPGDINATVVKSMIFDPTLFDRFMADMEKFSNTINNTAKSNLADKTKSNATLVLAVKHLDLGNNAYSFDVTGGEVVKVEVETDGEAGTIELTVTREPVDDIQDNPGMAIADKTTLVGILDKAIALIKGIVKHQKNSEKIALKFTEAMATIEKLINTAPADISANRLVGSDISATDPQAVRKVLRLVYKTSATSAKIEALLTTESLRCAKGALAFSAVCLKQYK